MPSIEEVYKRLETNKKQLRDIRKMMKDELEHSARYKEIQEEMKALREERKGIQNEVEASNSSEADQMEDLKLEIETDKELLSDLVMNKFMDNENVEIVDEYDNRWVPQFSVKFKRE